MSAAYPPHSVTDLIGGPLMTPPTSRALRDRLDPAAPPATPVLTDRQLEILAAVAARLVPQEGRGAPIDLAARLHNRLADGGGDGWRYADQPTDAAMVARGLDAVDRAAGGFAALAPAAQDRLLGDVQARRDTGPTWAGVSPALWFEEVLAGLVDLYYAHPSAQEEIGFVGMADARGWLDVGFAARASHEPKLA